MGVPEHNNTISVSLMTVSNVMDAFLDANFRGAYAMEKEIRDDGIVTVSVDYLAYFLRTLIADIYGRALLRIKAYANFSKLQFEFSYEGIKLTEGEMTELSAIAKEAGFKVSFYHSRALICTESKPNTVFNLYATTRDAIRGCFSFAFFGENAREIERYNRDVRGLPL